eukprot:symbB.v1.2.024845.t1/scaffold2378.1/size80641/4
MKSCFPPSLLEMIDANTWPGEGLMVYSDTGQPEAKAVVESPVASDSNDNDDRESHSGNIAGPPYDSNDDEREGTELDGSELGGSEVDGNEVDGGELGGSEVDGSESGGSEIDATDFPQIYDPNSDDCDDSPRSYDSIISKETLELGGSPIPSPPRDSQVSSAWLGQAYNAESRRMKKQQTLERLVQDAFNKAQKLMAMPTQPILVEEDGDCDRMPAVKRAKTGKDVQRALKGDSLMEVPRQSAIEVLLSSRALVKKQGCVAGDECDGERSDLRQVTWSKFNGPVEAWKIAKASAKFI